MSSSTSPVRDAAARSEMHAMAAAFLLSLTQLPQVRLVGTLYLHDFLVPVLLPFLLTRPGAKQALAPLRGFLFLAFLWLVGAIATDVTQHTAFEDYARGWSRIVLLIATAMVIWLLSRGRLRVLGTYMIGCGLVLFLRTWLFPNEFTTEDPWKFGYGSSLLFMIGGVSCFAQVRRYIGLYGIPLILLLISLYSLARNSRSAFAMAALASAYSAVATYIVHRPEWQRRITPASFLAFIVGGMVVAQALSGIYANAAADGLLGDRAREKYLQQTVGDTSLILGGRPESLVSFQAITDSPIIGHGSWARDHYYTLVYFDELRRRGLLVAPTLGQVTQITDDLIQAHSHILGSWVEAGILSLPFWIWVLVLCLRALYSAVRAHAVPSALVSLTAMMILWDTLFSPFAADARIIKAVQICILLAAVEIGKGMQQPSRILVRLQRSERRRAILLSRQSNRSAL